MNPDSFSGQPRQHIYDFNPREALARLGEVVWFVSHQALKNGLIDKHMFLTTPPVRCTTLSLCFCERLENGTHTWLELWFVVECGLSVKHMHEHLQVDRECFYSLPPGREWPECPHSAEWRDLSAGRGGEGNAGDIEQEVARVPVTVLKKSCSVRRL